MLLYLVMCLLRILARNILKYAIRVLTEDALIIKKVDKVSSTSS